MRANGQSSFAHYNTSRTIKIALSDILQNFVRNNGTWIQANHADSTSFQINMLIITLTANNGTTTSLDLMVINAGVVILDLPMSGFDHHGSTYYHSTQVAKDIIYTA